MSEPRWLFLSALDRVPSWQEDSQLADYRVESFLRCFPPERAQAIREAARKIATTTYHDYESIVYMLCSIAQEKVMLCYVAQEKVSTQFQSIVILPTTESALTHDKWWVGLERQHAATRNRRGRANEHGRHHRNRTDTRR